MSGQLEKLHKQVGDNVKQGDLIAEIDAEIYRTQVAGDEAGLKTLEAQHAEQRALVNQAKLIHQRNAKLIKLKAVSQELFEESLTNQRVAEAKLRSLDAQIEESKSTLEGNKAKLNYTKIYAPIDGTIVSQTAREGETLNANQTTPTIVQVANLDVMTVKAQVAEADIGKLKEGMPVYFTTLGSQGRRWEGTVRQILPTPENINDVVLYNVLMDIGNEDRALMKDMSAQMFFVRGSAKDVPLVPVGALAKRVPKEDKDKTQAYEVQVLHGRKPETRTIHIGMMNRSDAEVVDGLKPGNKVVLPKAIPTTKPGTPQGQNRQRGPRI